jgi:hypothetical protein
VYSGHPNRIERYNQYENMDQDSEVNACLDIISEFSTQVNPDNGTPFDINFSDKPTDHEVEIVKNIDEFNKLIKYSFKRKYSEEFVNNISPEYQIDLKNYKNENQF